LVGYPRHLLIAAINRHYGGPETQSVSSMLTEFTDTAIRSESRDIDLDDARVLRVRKPKSMPAPKPAARSRATAQGMVAITKELKGDEDSTDFELTLGEDATPDYGNATMWYYTVEEGQRALMIRKDGRIEVIVGPKRVWKGSNRFERMRHFVAHP